MPPAGGAPSRWPTSLPDQSRKYRRASRGRVESAARRAAGRSRPRRSADRRAGGRLVPVVRRGEQGVEPLLSDPATLPQPRSPVHDNSPRSTPDQRPETTGGGKLNPPEHGGQYPLQPRCGSCCGRCWGVGLRPQAEIRAVARSMPPAATLARCGSMSASVAMPAATSPPRMCWMVAASSAAHAGRRSGSRRRPATSASPASRSRRGSAARRRGRRRAPPAARGSRRGGGSQPLLGRAALVGAEQRLQRRVGVLEQQRAARDAAPRPSWQRAARGRRGAPAPARACTRSKAPGPGRGSVRRRGGEPRPPPPARPGPMPRRCRSRARARSGRPARRARRAHGRSAGADLPAPPTGRDAERVEVPERHGIEDRGERVEALARPRLRGCPASSPRPHSPGHPARPTARPGRLFGHILGRRPHRPPPFPDKTQLFGYPDTGHLIVWERPQEVVSDIAAFAGSGRAPGSLLAGCPP